MSERVGHSLLCLGHTYARTRITNQGIQSEDAIGTRLIEMVVLLLFSLGTERGCGAGAGG